VRLDGDEMTADADDGEFVVWDRDSGVSTVATFEVQAGRPGARRV